MVTIVSFLVVLSVLVLAHELGHFAVGRWAKARIEEFALGFPPRIWSVRRGETDYSINAIPLGGYVRFAGEDNPNVVGGLSSLPRLQRALVLVAGVTMNMVLAVIVMTVVYMVGYPTPVPTEGIRIMAVVEGSPAQQAGLQAGDVVVGANTEAMREPAAFIAYIRERAGQEVTLAVKNDAGTREVRLTPRQNPPAGQGPLGVAIEQATVIEKMSYPLPQAFVLGLQQTGRVALTTVMVPVMILRQQLPLDVARPSGPVGVARFVGGAAEAIPDSGVAPILLVTAWLSVSLAVVNILPLPGLDGGRLVFVVLEWLRGGKRIAPEREAIFHLAGLMLLLGLMVVITYFDIVAPITIPKWP